MKVYLKILSLALVTALSFSLVACSHSNATADRTDGLDVSAVSDILESTDTGRENTDTNAGVSVNNMGNNGVTFVPVENNESYTAVEM